jgi:acetaldehyde dehydrogenase (acetylating)
MMPHRPQQPETNAMLSTEGKMRVAILGSGNIGTDLLIKLQRSSVLRCTLFIGRNLSSAGLAKASSLGVPISDRSIEAILRDPDCCDLVFDATSARDHLQHWPILKQLGKKVIDLTPARVGPMCIPAVNLEECFGEQNVNMVTCGGQASIPMAHAIGRAHDDVEYIEVVSSIASRSAGPATRVNIDEYIETTEKAIQTFSGCRHSKAILILNPAQPSIDMQTTVFAKVARPDLDRLAVEVQAMADKIQAYVPGYRVIVRPTLENNRVVIMMRVTGLGDYLPKYAGNLDIINCAALITAEGYARAISRADQAGQPGERRAA